MSSVRVEARAQVRYLSSRHCACPQQTIFPAFSSYLLQSNSEGHQALQHMDFADLKCPIDSEGCPAHCSCEKNTYYREMIVNCSGQNLTKFPENVKLEQSLDAISLHLENNQLSSLADGNFEKYYASVSQLYLSNNRIVKFDDLKYSSLKLVYCY